jgi:hypothetical protein
MRQHSMEFLGLNHGEDVLVPHMDGRPWHASTPGRRLVRSNGNDNVCCIDERHRSRRKSSMIGADPESESPMYLVSSGIPYWRYHQIICS